MPESGGRLEAIRTSPCLDCRPKQLPQLLLRALEGDQDPLDTAEANPPLNLDSRNRLQLPTLVAVFVEHFSSLSPDIFPPIIPSRSSTTLYSNDFAMA